jgi:anti-sigma regulatory factor (Ser/Thr protein kinase)
MTMPRDIKVALEIPSDPSMLKMLRAVVVSMCGLAGFDEDQGRMLALGMEEACTNIMRHAYDGRLDETIRFEFSIDDTNMNVVITDQGNKVRPEDLKSRDLDDVKPGGLGVHFITKLFDTCNYDSSDPDHNQLCLTKKRSTSSEDSESSESDPSH